MADLASNYYEVDATNTQSFTSKRWFQVGAAFTVAFTVGYAATVVSTSNTAEPTNLLGQMNVQQVLSGLGNSPFKKPALLAIEAINSQGRDVSMKAIKAAVEEMDLPSQEKIDKARAKVLEIAKSMPGKTAPMDYFDPVGFSSKCTLGTLLFWREAELKHGRIGMIATLGIIMGEKFAPLLGAAKDVPAVYQLKGTTLGDFWPAVFVAIGFLELSKKEYSYSKVKKFGWWEIDDNDQVEMPAGVIPGDFGFDPLGLKPKDASKMLEMQN
jgi:light-harvesting complex I chlorophyll a/b binding protein 1